MRIIDLGGEWRFDCTYAERDLAKAAGFRWDADRRMWVTRDKSVAEAGRRACAEGALRLDPSLRREGEKWIYRSLPEDRELAKAAGFRFAPDKRLWYSRDDVAALSVASAIVTYLRQRGDAPEELLRHEEIVAELSAARDEALAASKADDAEIEVPAPEGCEYLGYQRAGVAFALSHPRCIIGDEMGLGKTIQAIGVMNACPEISRVLIVCPLGVSLNWQREIERWSVTPRRIGRASASQWPEDAEVVIIHPQILIRHPKRIRGPWDLLIVDEAHLFKSSRAERTRVLLGGEPGAVAKRALMLTGTPIPNRPIEAWPLLSFVDPTTWSSRSAYAVRYCGGHHNGWGWDESGATHMDELRERLRTSVMVRRLKADVLHELPAKRRQVVTLDASDLGRNVVAAQKREAEAKAAAEARIVAARAAVELAKASDDRGAYEEAVKALRNVTNVAFSEMSKVRHDLAVAKAPAVVEHVSEMLDDRVEKVVCWAHHHDVVDVLQAGLERFGVVVVTGETPAEERQACVDAFQGGAPRVFVGSITAAGVGITLTAASVAVFAELDWVPGNVSQSEDRCHRIGQRESVLIQHLVVDGSLDAQMVQTIMAKQAVADRVLDSGEHPAADPVEVVGAVVANDAASAGTTRDRLGPIAERVSEEGRAAIHAGLKFLAAYDPDGASTINGVGFSKIDVAVGHSLADTEALSARQAALGALLVRKYRRQLPEDLVSKATACLAGAESTTA